LNCISLSFNYSIGHYFYDVLKFLPVHTHNGSGMDFSLGVLGDAVIHSTVSGLQSQDLGPASDHVGLGAPPHLDGDGLVITGQEDCLPLHCLKLPGDAGRREAAGLAVQGQVGPLRTIRVLKNILLIHKNKDRRTLKLAFLPSKKGQLSFIYHLSDCPMLENWQER